MPIYAYKCESCGHRRDVLQKISDPLLTVCPSCSAEAFSKQVTAAGFQLKGSGWYVTDFRDVGASAKGEKTDGKTDEKKGEKGAEAKPDVAPAPAADAAKPAESKPAGSASPAPAPSAPASGS